MQPAIRIERLSKRYRIGSRRPGSYRTLREAIMENMAAPWRRLKQLARRPAADGGDEIWALQDVTAEIQPGEVVGIIGRNGAGKSTLLKVLSRVTEPTAGRVEVRGRLGSLLEVGTGFHPELTGRENIFLNGAILGMTRGEIARKFDAIVAFAEIEKFLDTPVKRYSSGMYVRLAFAVAAHLEPEILLVDEVLAVGDAAFQKKCVRKMHDVARSGRTVLFVSHNMATVLQICHEAILLEAGRLVARGTAAEVTEQYLSAQTEAQADVFDLTGARRTMPVQRHAELVACRLATAQKSDAWSVSYGAELSLAVRVRVNVPLNYLELGLAINTATGFEVASSLSCDALPPRTVAPGDFEFQVSYPALTLRPNRYYFGFGLRSEHGFEDYVAETAYLDVLPTLDSVQKNVQLRLGAVIPELKCTLVGIQPQPLAQAEKSEP